MLCGVRCICSPTRVPCELLSRGNAEAGRPSAVRCAHQRPGRTLERVRYFAGQESFSTSLLTPDYRAFGVASRSTPASARCAGSALLSRTPLRQADCPALRGERLTCVRF